MQSVSDDVRKRRLEKPRFELAAEATFLTVCNGSCGTDFKHCCMQARALPVTFGGGVRKILGGRPKDTNLEQAYTGTQVPI